MFKQIEAKIYGKVQGVYFRASARDKALELGIKGFVRNESDGSVYIKAEAEAENIKNYIKWLQKGPEWAVVEKVDYKEVPNEGFKTFEIIY